jgi:hypothetical protein
LRAGSAERRCARHREAAPGARCDRRGRRAREPGRGLGEQSRDLARWPTERPQPPPSSSRSQLQPLPMSLPDRRCTHTRCRAFGSSLRYVRGVTMYILEARCKLQRITLTHSSATAERGCHDESAGQARSSDARNSDKEFRVQPFSLCRGGHPHPCAQGHGSMYVLFCLYQGAVAVQSTGADSRAWASLMASLVLLGLSLTHHSSLQSSRRARLS